MRTIAVELVILLASSVAGAQTTFGVNKGPRATDDEETHRIVTKALSDIASAAKNAGESKEAIEDVFVRSQNDIRRIGARGGQAVPEVHIILTDPSIDWKVKAMMCEALGKINTPESAAELGKVLTDKNQNEFVRAVAGDKLALLGRPETEDIIKRTVVDKTVPLQVRERTMMSVGVAGLNDVDWLKNVAVGDGLGLSSDRHAPFSQEEAGIMMNAQRALGKSKNPKAIDALIELQAKYPTNGIYTEKLAEKNDPRAIPVLIQTLTYKNPRGFTSDAMILAAKALGDMKAKAAASPLAEIIENDENPLFVVAAARALAQIDPGRAKPLITKLIAGLPRDDRFRREKHPAFWTQEKAGWGPIADLKNTMQTVK